MPVPVCCGVVDNDDAAPTDVAGTRGQMPVVTATAFGVAGARGGVSDDTSAEDVAVVAGLLDTSASPVLVPAVEFVAVLRDGPVPAPSHQLAAVATWSRVRQVCLRVWVWQCG